MAFINPDRTEVTAKIVYYGPGLSGKTTCFHHIYRSLPAANKGKLLSLATNIDRTIYFDFLPLKFENIQGLNLRIQLYTVPGQVRFDATRKQVLNDVDGLVFVADMQREANKPNQESMKNLYDNLRELQLDLQEIPHVLQYNKEDLPNLMSLEELNGNLNLYKAPSYVTCALSGKGVMDALKGITKLVVADVKKRKTIERHMAEVAREAEARVGERKPRPAEKTEAGDVDPQAMARRLIQSGLRAPVSRMDKQRPPSTETLERNIKSGLMEEVVAQVPAPEPEEAGAIEEEALTLDLEDEEGIDTPPSPPEPEEHPGGGRREKEIVVFSDRAEELQSGIHRRKTRATSESGDVLGIFGAGEDAIEETLSQLPDDEGDILGVEGDKANPQKAAAPSRSTAAGSFAALLQDDDARENYRHLETQVAEGNFEGFGARAARTLARILTDPELFPEEGGTVTDPAKLNLLGVKYRRYLEFKKTVQRRSNQLTPDDALICLHFLLDVELAKREQS